MQTASRASSPTQAVSKISMNKIPGGPNAYSPRGSPRRTPEATPRGPLYIRGGLPQVPGAGAIVRDGLYPSGFASRECTDPLSALGTWAEQAPSRELLRVPSVASAVIDEELLRRVLRAETLTEDSLRRIVREELSSYMHREASQYKGVSELGASCGRGKLTSTQPQPFGTRGFDSASPLGSATEPPDFGDSHGARCPGTLQAAMSDVQSLELHVDEDLDLLTGKPTPRAVADSDDLDLLTGKMSTPLAVADAGFVRNKEQPSAPKQEEAKCEFAPSAVTSLHELQQESTALAKEAGDANWKDLDSKIIVHVRTRFEQLSARLDKYINMKEPERTGVLHRIVQLNIFSATCNFFIFLNAVYMLVATNYEIRHYQQGSTPLMEAIEYVFLAWFTFELILKISVHRGYFFFGEDAFWNGFDALLVGSSLFQQLMTGDNFDATFMRALRVLKLGKALRMFRLLRVFTDLRLLMNSITGSMGALCWSLVLMAIVFFVFAIAIVQGVTSYLVRENDPDAEPLNQHVKQNLLEYFGDVQMSMLTMFAATTGGTEWFNHYHDLRSIGIFYAIIWLFFVAFCQIAFFNIVTALFTEHAISLAQPDREDVVYASRKSFLKERDELRHICNDVDRDGTGNITLAEFQAQMEDHRSTLRTYLESTGLDVTDAELFFHMIMSDDHQVALQPFIDGVLKMRGGVTGLDMQIVLWQLQRMYDDQSRRLQQLTKQVDSLASEHL